MSNPEPPDDIALHTSFGDLESLLNSRDWLQAALVSRGATVTGSGCGFGACDIEISLEGFPFLVTMKPL